MSFRESLINFLTEVTRVLSEKNIGELVTLTNYIKWIAPLTHIEIIQKALVTHKEKIISRDEMFFINHTPLRNWLYRFISDERLDEMIEDLWFGTDMRFHENIWLWLDKLSN